jgi:hypothetical protein
MHARVRRLNAHDETRRRVLVHRDRHLDDGV